MYKYLIATALFTFLSLGVMGQPSPPISKVWVADQGNGTYKNPVLNADYSDGHQVRI